MKAEGNKHFKKNEMEQALRWYRSGIVICPPGKDRALLHRCDSRDALWRAHSYSAELYVASCGKVAIV